MEFNLDPGVKGKKIQEHLLRTKGTAYLKLPEFAKSIHSLWILTQ